MQGHIHKRVRRTKAGQTTTRWYVVLDVGRNQDGRRRQKWHGGFETRKEAEAARAQLVTDLHRGNYVALSGVTLEAWVEGSWLPTMRSQVKQSTWDSSSRNMRLHIIPKLGRLKLQQVTPTGLNALYSDLLDSGRRSGEGGLSPKTVRYVHSIIHKALADAIDAGLLATNSADKAKPPRNGAHAAPEIQTWTAEELSLFLKSVDGHRLEAAWHLAAMTGMRRGEVLGLRWKDVDFRGARVSVHQAFVSVAYEVVASTPKTHQARVIDLDAGTVRQLRTHWYRQQKERYDRAAST